MVRERVASRPRRQHALIAARCCAGLAAAALHAALRRLLRQPERGEAWQQQCVTLLQHTAGAERGAA